MLGISKVMLCYNDLQKLVSDSFMIECVVSNTKLWKTCLLVYTRINMLLFWDY